MRRGAGWKGLYGNYLSELEAQPGGPSGRPLTTAGSKPIKKVGRPRGERPFPTSSLKEPAPLTSSRTRYEKKSTTRQLKATLRSQAAAYLSHTRYDARSFLQNATDTVTGALTQPTYSSEGLLHALDRQSAPAATIERFLFLYFAGRPVAQLKLDGGTGGELRYLITDHLTTPWVALDETAAEIWDSSFAPFGRDSEEGSPTGALANEVFLRFPGQWEDGRWAGAAFGAEAFYNVHRWYLPANGVYSRPDPVGVGSIGFAPTGRLSQHALLGPRRAFPDKRTVKAGVHGGSPGSIAEAGNYVYGLGNPLVFSDPLGLEPVTCSVFSLGTPGTGRGPDLSPVQICLVVGACVASGGKVYITGGLIKVPDCFDCPKECTFEADTNRPAGENSWNWQCEPWTPIVDVGPPF